MREKKEKDKGRQRFWEVAGSKMGKITGALLRAWWRASTGWLAGWAGGMRACWLGWLHACTPAEEHREALAGLLTLTQAPHPPTHPPPLPLAAGLTEAEAEEGAKAAAAAREQAGASDDDDDDYRQASKVGGRGRGGWAHPWLL